MCEDLGFIRLVYFGKNILDIIYIIVPILLILMLAIDIGKMVLSSNGFDKKIMSMILKRSIAAVALFFLPAVLFYLVNLTGVSSSDDGLLCWNKADAATITRLEAAKELEEEIKKKEKELKEAEKLKAEEEKKEEESVPVVNGIPVSKSYKPFINGVQRNLEKGECMKKEDNCFCPTVGKNIGFQFTVESESGRNFNWTNRSDKIVYVKVDCGDGTSIGRYVNVNAQTQFETAFKKLCQIRSTGINGVKVDSDMLFIDGTLVERLNSARTVCSPHAYGFAIDINYSMPVIVNGKTYMPWAGQGVKTKEEYDRFVKAIGRESDIRNVNYILWKHVFEPSGFIWGGDWNPNSFDPMHYEVK